MLGNSPEGDPHSLGCRLEFPHCKLRQEKGQIASLECLQQAAGRFAELIVLAASQNRRVRVDPGFMEPFQPSSHGAVSTHHHTNTFPYFVNDGVRSTNPFRSRASFPNSRTDGPATTDACPNRKRTRSRLR